MHIISSLIKCISMVAASAALFACSNGAVSTDGSVQHPSDADWVHKHSAKYVENSVSSGCASCHGSDLSGGISKVSCMSTTPVIGFSCHATSPANSPTGCISCHAVAPEGPDGLVFPNRQRAHGHHTGLPGVNVNANGQIVSPCVACHNGLGAGTSHHADGTQVVAISPVFNGFYNLSSATSKPTDGGTCSNVSCHGGKKTPSWSNTGVLALVSSNNTPCLGCHESGTALGAPQFNSFYSGNPNLVPSGLPNNTTDNNNPVTTLHQFHLNKADVEFRAQGVQPTDTAKAQGYAINGTIYCTDCHSLSSLKDASTHYGGLVNRPMSLQNPGATISNENMLYSPDTSKCNNVLCHINKFGPNWK